MIDPPRVYYHFVLNESIQRSPISAVDFYQAVLLLFNSNSQKCSVNSPLFPAPDILFCYYLVLIPSSEVDLIKHVLLSLPGWDVRGTVGLGPGVEDSDSLKVKFVPMFCDEKFCEQCDDHLQFLSEGEAHEQLDTSNFEVVEWWIPVICEL